MIAHRCKNMRVLLLLLLCSPFLLQGVVAAMDGISEQCQTCMSLWEASSTKPTKKKCKNKCSKEQEKDGGEMVLEPVCNKKKCCKKLCKYDEAHMACKKTKHCSKKEYNRMEAVARASTPPPTESPSKSPTPAPTKSPTQSPTTALSTSTSFSSSISTERPTPAPTLSSSPTITFSPTIERCPKGRPSVLDNLHIHTYWKFGKGHDDRALKELVDICIGGPANVDNLPCPFGNIAMNCWDVTGVKSMRDVFSEYRWSYQTEPQHNEPLDLWDVSSVTDMGGMFRYAKKFNQPIGSWDVSNVRNFDSMFNGAIGYNNPLNTWVTSSATNMDFMFYDCEKFNQPPLDQWDTSSVNSMTDMYGQTVPYCDDD